MLNNGVGMTLALMYPPLNLHGFIKRSANDFVVKEIPLVRFKLQRLLFPLKFTNAFTEKGIFIISKV